MKIIRSLLLLVIIAVIIVFLAFDNIAKSVITSVGSKSLTTTLDVSKVKSSFSKKSLNINGIKVKNLTGFESKSIFAIDNFAVNIEDVSTDLIIIDKIEISQITVNAEQNKDGLNIKLLIDRLTKNTESSQNNTKQNSDDDDEMRIIIRKFIITGGDINIKSKILTESVKLPKISVSAIGGENGVLAKNMGAHLTKILLKNIEKIIKTKGLELAKGKIKETLTRKISEKLGLKPETLTNLKDSLGDKTNELKEQLQDKTQDLKEDLKNKFKNMLSF